MAEFSAQHTLFAQYGATIYALSADQPTQSQSFKKEIGLPFTLLCDPDRAVIKQYHLFNPDEHGGIAYPSVFIIDSQGIIHYRSLDRTYNRVDLSEVLSFVKEIAQNPGLTKRSDSAKQFIVPTPKALLQIARNMLFRGTWQDWKHYILYVIRPILRVARPKKDHEKNRP